MNIPPILTNVRIVENKEIRPGYFLLTFYSQDLVERIIPGQFLHIRIDSRLDIILRRPFSVFNCDRENVSILYEVVGKGTSVLSRKRIGEVLNILGPLGNGFSIPFDIKNVALIGGGIGIAPLFLLAKELKEKGIGIEVFIGAKSKTGILCVEDFKRIGIEPQIATDDGSYGYKGFVTELFRASLEARDYIYACGPNEMLKELARFALNGEVSLDTQMGCGMGVCLGCVVKTKTGYKRVCKDGPVFRIDEVMWI